jgi:hypothetical protein
MTWKRDASKGFRMLDQSSSVCQVDGETIPSPPIRKTLYVAVNRLTT